MKVISLNYFNFFLKRIEIHRPLDGFCKVIALQVVFFLMKTVIILCD